MFGLLKEGLLTDGQRSIKQDTPVSCSLCEPNLALSNSSLFISLMSLAGCMLLIKHAAWLLIVNQIQFVPWACHEWASLPGTKVSEQPCQSWTKGPRHHFYLKQEGFASELQTATEWGVNYKGYQEKMLRENYHWQSHKHYFVGFYTLTCRKKT